MRSLFLIGLLALAPASSQGQGPTPVTAPTATDTLAWERVGDRPIGPMALAFDGAGALYGGDYGVYHLDLSAGFPGTWELRNDRHTVDAMIGLGPDTLVSSGEGIRRSTDGGLTWPVVYESRTSGSQGLVEGPTGTPHAGILFLAGLPVAASPDRGATWEPRGHMPGQGNQQGEAHALAPLASGRLVAGGYWGTAYSDDGGHTWVQSSLWGFLSYFVEFVAVAERPGGGQRVVAVGDGPGPHLRAWHSDDGGETWWPEGGTPLPQVNDGHGYGSAAGLVAVGGSTVVAVLGRGVVYRSDDGGATWAEVGRVPEMDEDLRAATAMLSPDGRVYVGLVRQGASNEGEWVWRTQEAVPVAQEPEPQVAPAGLGLSVRPNPTRGSAEVAVTLLQPAEVEVALYDVLGRRVAVVHNGILAAGEHQLPVEVGHLPTGVYVVRAAAGEVVETAQLTLVR